MSLGWINSMGSKFAQFIQDLRLQTTKDVKLALNSVWHEME